MNKIVNDINKSLKNCSCKFSNTKGTNYISSNSDHIDVMFIAQNPGKKWYNKQVNPEDIIPFALDKKSSYHEFFDRFKESFSKHYRRSPNFYITNIAKCCTGDNTLKEQDMIDICVKKYLKKEILYFKKYNDSLKIITLGKVASEVFKKYFDEKNIDLPHPGWLNRQNRIHMKNSITKLMEYIDG